MSFVFFIASLFVSQVLSQSAPSGPGVVTVYFFTEWATPYVHYDAGSGWTVPPGVPMLKSTNTSFPTPPWWIYSLYANQLTFVFNDDHGNWDHPSGGGNYFVNSPGIFSVQKGQITVIQRFPPGCPSCTNGGVCNNSTGTCVCKSGFYGPDCSGVCPGAPNNICNGEGTCNDGSSGNGECVCFGGWSTCGLADPCTVNLKTDPKHCGNCTTACATGQGVKSSQCVDSNCVVQCDSGYTLCFGQCVPGNTCSNPPLPGCSTFSLNQCQGNNIVTPDKFEASRWWTPHPEDKSYLPSYGDYYRLVGHAHVTYSASRTSATIELIPVHVDPNVTFSFLFGNKQSSNPTYEVTDSSGSNPVLEPFHTKILASDGASLELPEIDLLWNVPTLLTRAGDFRNGQKGGIIEMFGWPHSEIESECETIGQSGWLGVKVFPAQEQLMSYQPFNNIMNPWYFMYQPISYRLEGRMGTRDDLRKMIATCRKYGVRVYADAVVNHMTGGGNDANSNHRFGSGGSCTNWGNKTTSASDPSPFYTQDFAYTYNDHTDQPPSQEFPAVPYSPTDFHCERALNSWNDPLDLNAGWLEGLTDLNTEKPNVRMRIADYMTDLLGIGFSGFRVDAAKHIQPDDLVAIFTNVRNNLGGSFPADFITWWEILLGGEAQLLMCNKDSGYNYGAYIHDALLAAGFSSDDVDKVKIWNSGYPKEPDADCGSITKWRNVIQNDDADQQNQGSTSRDMGDQGTVLVVAKNVPLHRSFEVKLFTNPNGASDNDNDYPIRALLSSYYFPQNEARGIPDGKSDCSLCTTTCNGCETVPYQKAFDPNSCGYDNPQFNQYTRTHRDKSIIMAMRQWMHMSANVSNTALGLPEAC